MCSFKHLENNKKIQNKRQKTRQQDKTQRTKERVEKIVPSRASVRLVPMSLNMFERARKKMKPKHTTTKRGPKKKNHSVYRNEKKLEERKKRAELMPNATSHYEQRVNERIFFLYDLFVVVRKMMALPKE